MIIDKETISFLKTPSLVLHVQQLHLEYEKAKKEKRETLKKNKEIKQCINQYRFVLQDRLKQMNRYSPEFFPKKSLVSYSLELENGVMQKKGRVVGHSGGFVQVQFEGETYQTKVDPITLTLLFIRSVYY